MNGLDTNVLIRYFTADDETQAAKAKRHADVVNCAAPVSGVEFQS